MSLDEDIDRLTAIPMLGMIEPGALRLLAFSGETRILRRDDVLFRRGDPSDGGILILSGSVILDDGREDRDDDHPSFGPGTLLGETALLRETACPATAVAQETSTILKLPRVLFLRMLREHPDSAQRVMHFLAQRLRGTLVGARAS